MSSSRIIIVGSVPPPVAGQSLATQFLLDALAKTGADCRIVDISDRVDRASVGSDVARFLEVIWFPVKALKASGLKRGDQLTLYLQLGQSSKAMIRDLPLLWLGRLFRWRIVGHLHGASWRVAYDRAPVSLQALMKSAIQHADSLIVLTESARSMFDGLVDPDRVTVIGNCIEPWLEERACSHSPVLGSPPKILYLGNLITGKGVETLGAAARLSYAAGNDSQFIVAGLGDESLLGSPTPPNMKLLGQVLGDRKVQALASADVLVLPSELNEGEPISVLEAFHFGIPVVATGNGGLRDLVQPEAGRVFEAGDADALLRAVAEVLEPEAWLRMSNRNQKVARADHSSAAHEISMLQALGVNR